MRVKKPPAGFVSSGDSEKIPEGCIPVVIGHDPVGRVLGDLKQELVAGYIPQNQPADKDHHPYLGL